MRYVIIVTTIFDVFEDVVTFVKILLNSMG